MTTSTTIEAHPVGTEPFVSTRRFECPECGEAVLIKERWATIYDSWCPITGISHVACRCFKHAFHYQANEYIHAEIVWEPAVDDMQRSLFA